MYWLDRLTAELKAPLYVKPTPAVLARLDALLPSSTGEPARDPMPAEPIEPPDDADPFDPDDPDEQLRAKVLRDTGGDLRAAWAAVFARRRAEDEEWEEERRKLGGDDDEPFQTDNEGEAP